MYKVIFFDMGDTLVVSSNGWLPGAADLLHRLHQHKMRLGIISNTGEMSREKLADLLPADFSWDVFEDKLVILSSEVKIEKPSPGIFRLAGAGLVYLPAPAFSVPKCTGLFSCAASRLTCLPGAEATR